MKPLRPLKKDVDRIKKDVDRIKKSLNIEREEGESVEDFLFRKIFTEFEEKRRR